jgi:hypothetical protein
MKSNLIDAEVSPGSIVIGKSGKQFQVAEVVDSGYILTTGQKIARSAVVEVLPPAPLDQEVIDYAELCLSCPDITEAEAIDSILNFRQALTPAEMAELIQALPPKLAKRLYALQELHDRHLIPIGATVYVSAGTGALVVARAKDRLTIRSDGKEWDTPPAKVLRWKYPVSDQTIYANEQN